MKLKLSFMFLLFSFSLRAQSGVEEFVSDSGVCYGYCKLPLVYKTDTVQKLISGAHKILITTPLAYDVLNDTIQIPVYDSMSNIEPGVYDLVPKSVIVTDMQGHQHSFVYQELTVLQQPDTVYEVKPPVVFYTTTYTEIEKPGISKMNVPPQYKTVLDTQEVVSGKSYGFVEIVCPKDETPELIIQIKKMLSLHGFSISDFSGVWTDDDEKMLKQYQQKNNLPVGHMNKLTLEYLGIL